MVIENSVSVKSRLNEQVKEYLMSLQANNEDTKQHYAAMIGFFVDYLLNKGIERFEDATSLLNVIVPPRTSVKRFTTANPKP